MLKKITDWFAYDPKAKQKIIFIIIATLIIGSFGYLLFYINFNQGSEEQQVRNEEITLEEESGFFVEERPVFNFNLESYQTILNQPIGLTGSVHFSAFSDDVYYINPSFKLNINDQEVANSPTFLPYSLKETREVLIINEADSSTFFAKAGQSFTRLPEGSVSVLPFENEYYFLEQVNDRIDLKKSLNILLQRPERVVTIRSEIDNYKGLELKELNGNMYIFVYQTAEKQGKLEIWKVMKTERTAVKIKEIEKLVSSKFSNKQFLYTQLLEGIHSSSVLDFSNNLDGVDFRIENRLFRDKDILGNLIAARCQISNQISNIYCPIKKSRVSANDVNYPDEIVIINYVNQNIFLPFTESFSNPVSHIILNPEERLFFISRKDGLLYRLGDDNMFF